MTLTASPSPTLSLQWVHDLAPDAAMLTVGHSRVGVSEATAIRPVPIRSFQAECPLRRANPIPSYHRERLFRLHNWRPPRPRRAAHPIRPLCVIAPVRFPAWLQTSSVRARPPRDDVPDHAPSP